VPDRYPYPPDPDQPTLVSPTVALPEVRGGHARHADSGSSTRWLIPALAAGMLVAVILGALTALMMAGGGSGERPSAAAQPAGTEASADPMASATLDPSPSTSPSASPDLRPADLIAGLRTTIRQLQHDGNLDEDPAEELDKGLRDAARALADGNVNRTWDKLHDVASKIAHLHEEGDLSDRDFQSLATKMTQLAQALPRP